MAPPDEAALTSALKPVPEKIAQPATPADIHSVILAEQQTANKAAIVPTKPRMIKKSALQRPDYVSPLEWNILQGLAAQSADHDAALARLINKLHFSKQRDAMQNQEINASARARLAEQLLKDIPDQLHDGNLDFSEAQKLQEQLLEVIVSDPEQRRLRANTERQRLQAEYVKP